MSLPHVPPLPTDAVLLHIGPHKTGTTAIQASLAESRHILAEHRAFYPGKGKQHSRQAMAAIGRTYGWKSRGGAEFPRTEWEQLAKNSRKRSGRVVISSEFFDEATKEQASEICDELGRERVHVLVTLRPLSKILASSWQQFVKNGSAVRFEEWLTAILEAPPASRYNPVFWQRHDHADLVDRWTAVVGPARVTVAMVDESDQDRLYHLVEQLLDLPADSLRRPPSDASNRSMSAVESEVMRRINVAASKKRVPWRSYQAVIRDGANRRMLQFRVPPTTEPRIVTPGWALDRAAEIGAEAARRISASGVRVLGDVSTLGLRPPDLPDHRLPDSIDLESAAELVIGALSGAMQRGPDFGAPRAAWTAPDSYDLEGVPTKALVAKVRERVAERAREATRKGRGRSRRG